MAPRRRAKSATTTATANSTTTPAPLTSSSNAGNGGSTSAAAVSPTLNATATATTNGPASTSAPSRDDHTVGSVEDACLHCHTAAPSPPPATATAASGAGATQQSHVQVRCDECGGYICNDCHWCHEFQANHEIRVCDRCDAFYCKACDEMDQCDDCGEVVCGGCSTLLSCKFCGGGLCEDCATACGRCGIVLCSRDAKFAVDCDTCRLSYCLVCLASGSKDPCVRCGHRPSKRMEQLVHLRLKSIYKAFKQSSGTNTAHRSSHHSVGAGAGTASYHHSHHPTSSSRTASTASEQPPPRGHRPDKDQEDWRDMIEDCDTNDPEALLRAAASAAAAAAAASSSSSSIGPVQPPHGSGGGGRWRHGASSGSHGQSNAPASHMPATASERLELYLAEKERADKAAADLLAELDEEEEHKKSKKSKKKRKKERQQQLAKKEEGDEGDDGDHEDGPTVGAANDNDEDVEPKPRPPSSPSRRGALSADGDEAANLPPPAPPDHVHRRDSSSDALPLEPLETAETDPLEEELEQLIDDGDSEGIDALLTSIKGVPGRAVLRKNAKKALKRLRAEQDSAAINDGLGDVDDHYAAPAPLVRAPEVVTAPAPTEESSKFAATTGPSTTIKPRSKSTTAGPAGSSRTEGSMPIDPAMVGWIIGKGGQRIRDLMEESGARIWIDQDSMGPHDPRTVFFSGSKRTVEAAMALVADLVDKSQSKQTTPLAESTGTSKPKHSIDTSKTPPSLPDPFDLAKPTPSTFGLKPRRKDTTDVAANAPSASPPSNSDPAKAEHVITCDPRFVPLLIGRRGWTIKNIQDSSGARVDIDQSVSPRRITISGSDRNVKIAIRMVRDVLSYPHSQLQGVLEKEHDLEDGPDDSPPKKPEIHDAAVARPNDAVDVADAPASLIDSPHHVEPATRGANSPPSSLIMTGDAKSTISASSSLSSTPEPSMASSIPKGGYPLIPAGPMLPPAFGFSSFDPAPTDNAAPDQSAPVSGNPYLFPQEAMYGMPAAPAPSMQDPLLPSGLVQASPVPHRLGVSAMPPSQAFQMPQPSAPFPRSPGGALGPLSGSHRQPLNHQPGAFQPPHAGFTVPSAHATMMHVNTKAPSYPMANQSEGLWNGITPQAAGVPLPTLRPEGPGTVDSFRLDAAVDFLQSRSLGGIGPPSQPHQGIGSDTIGLPNLSSDEKRRLVQGPAVSTVLLQSTPDESQIVDSLFGPPSGCTTSEGGLLMTGIQGLSLGKEPLGASLWEPDTLGGDTLQGLSGFGSDERNHSQRSHLFASHPMDDHHPPQSRFAWGSFADRQQS